MESFNDYGGWDLIEEAVEHNDDEVGIPFHCEIEIVILNSYQESFFYRL